MDEPNVVGSAAGAIIDTVKALHGHQLVAVMGAPDGSTLSADIMLVPEGLKAISLKDFRDQYRTRPERMRGTAIVTTPDTYHELTARHATPDSAIFALADRTHPALTTVIDYHQRSDVIGTAKHRCELADFGQHRVHYPLVLSDQWRAWREVNGKSLDQATFAALLEDRALDLAPVPEWLRPGTDTAPTAPGDIRLRDAVARLTRTVAGPERLLELSRGLDLTEKSEVVQRVNLDSGETAFTFKSEHRDSAGDRVQVPNLFLIAIPVFQNASAWLMAVRLRYKLSGQRVTWSVAMMRHEETFDAAIAELASRAAQETGLPLYYGQPEMKGIDTVERA